MTDTLREWFEAEPWRSSGELLERLRTAHPGMFEPGQLRTLQRRVKSWRSEAAHKLVFGASAAASTSGAIVIAGLQAEGAILMTGASMRQLIDAVEPCAFGAPLRGCGARPRR